jgi:hypothetical protein
MRVIEGEVRLIRSGREEESEILTVERRGVVEPAEAHRVEPLGPMRMRVDFLRSGVTTMGWRREGPIAAPASGSRWLIPECAGNAAPRARPADRPSVYPRVR